MNKPIIAVLGSGLGGTIAAFEVKEAVGASWSVAMQPDSMAAASDAVAR